MKNEPLLTRSLAATGTALVWFPILAPILITAIFFLETRLFRFDYLMPAELFVSALLGGALLLWAALRARLRRGLIGWSLGLSAAFLAGAQLLAIITGMASGETEPEGLWFALVLAMLAAYSLCLVLMGIGGGLLLRDLFRRAV